MPSRALQIIALTLTALGLAPGAAHVLELPVKLTYSPALYAEVTSTLYAWFGAVGGSVQVLALVAVATLAFGARQGRSGGLLAASAGALAASLLLWGFVVAPVNSTWSDSAGAGPADFVAAYERLRERWEYGHVAAFVAWLTGWFGLVAALTRHPALER